MKDRYFIVLLCVLVLLAEVPFIEYITDDTFIHLQFAKNLIRGDGLSFNAGQPTYGFTSPLWVFLIALGGLVGGELLAVSKLVGALALAACAVVFYLLALRVTSDRFLSRTSAVVWALNAWSVRWGISGMETSLVAAWSVLSLYFLYRENETGKYTYSPWIVGLACLVRPEALLLLLLCWAAAFTHAYRSRRRLPFRMLVPGLCVTLVWFGYAMAQFASLTPNTVSVKAGRFISLTRIGEGTYVVAKILGLTNALELCLSAAAIILCLVLAKRRSLPGAFHLAAAGWVVLLPAAYVLRDVQVVSRYLVPVMPFIVLYGFLSIRRIGEIVGMTRSRVRQATWAVACVAVVLNLSVLGLVAYPHTHSFSRDMRQSLVRLGEWFARNTPEDATVAIPDIGAFAYYSNRRVVDLGGLVTPEMIPVLRKHELDEVLTGFLFAEVTRPDYVVDRARREHRLLEVGRLGGVVTPVVSGSVSNLGITRPGTHYYTAYKIDWQRFERAESQVGQSAEQSRNLD